jgi:hypothetical protein
VPFALVTHVLRNNLEKQFKTLIKLKLLFPQGNFKLDEKVIEKVKKQLGFRDKRTFKSHFNRLLELNWIWKDKRTSNYNLRSFVVICELNEIEYHGGYEIGQKDLKSFSAWLGGVIFDYCTLRFWQKFIKSEIKVIKIGDSEYFKLRPKGKDCVLNKGGNNITLPFGRLLHEPAFSALEGVSKFLRINKSKVNRLKQEAILKNYISVKHNHHTTNIPTNIPKATFDFFQGKFIEISKEEMDSFENTSSGLLDSKDCLGYSGFGQGEGVLIKLHGKIRKIDIDIIQPIKTVRKRIKKYRK